MTNLTRSNFQTHRCNLVSPSPWFLSYSSLTLCKWLLLLIKEKSELKGSIILLRLKDIFPLIYSLFTVLILPMFFLNVYLFGGYHSTDITMVSYSMLLFICFLSCSNIYLIFMLGWNIFYKNKGNIYRFIYHLYLQCLSYRRFNLYIVLLLLLFIIFIFILSKMGLIFVLSCIGITKSNYISYLYIRISLLPVMIYMYNIIISNIINYYSKEKQIINYSLFSRNMVESLTLRRLLCIIGFIVTFFLGNIFINHIFYNNKNYLTILNNIDINNISLINSYGLSKPLTYHHSSYIFNALSKTFYLHSNIVSKDTGNIVNYITCILSTFYNAITGKSCIYVKSEFISYSLPRVVNYLIEQNSNITISKEYTINLLKNIDIELNVNADVSSSKNLMGLNNTILYNNIIFSDINAIISEKILDISENLKFWRSLDKQLTSNNAYNQRISKKDIDDMICKFENKLDLFHNKALAVREIQREIEMDNLIRDRIIASKRLTVFVSSVDGSLNNGSNAISGLDYSPIDWGYGSPIDWGYINFNYANFGHNRNDVYPYLSIQDNDNSNPNEDILESDHILDSDSEISEVDSDISVSSSFIASLHLDKGKGIDIEPQYETDQSLFVTDNHLSDEYNNTTYDLLEFSSSYDIKNIKGKVSEAFYIRLEKFYVEHLDFCAGIDPELFTMFDDKPLTRGLYIKIDAHWNNYSKDGTRNIRVKFRHIEYHRNIYLKDAIILHTRKLPRVYVHHSLVKNPKPLNTLPFWVRTPSGIMEPFNIPEVDKNYSSGKGQKEVYLNNKDKWLKIPWPTNCYYVNEVLSRYISKDFAVRIEKELSINLQNNLSSLEIIKDKLDKSFYDQAVKLFSDNRNLYLCDPKALNLINDIQLCSDMSTIYIEKKPDFRGFTEKIKDKHQEYNPYKSTVYKHANKYIHMMLKETYSGMIVHIVTPWLIKKSITISSSINLQQDDLKPREDDIIPGFRIIRRALGSKLNDLYRVNKHRPINVFMTDSKYADRISVLDHNVVCKSILDAGSPLQRNIILDGDSSRYNGRVTVDLIKNLQR